MPDQSIKYLHVVAHGDPRRGRATGVHRRGSRRDGTAIVGAGAREGAMRSSHTSPGSRALSTLTASIAHEVNQPLSGIITNASTCLRMLAADPPDVDGARETARRTIRDGNRASDVITRLRALFSKKEFDDSNRGSERGHARGHRAVVERPSAKPRGASVGARRGPPDRHRRSCPAPAGHPEPAPQRLGRDGRRRRSPAAIADQNRTRGRRSCAREVRDAGVGVDPQSMDKLFDAFYTTKSDGMGIGLSVSRSIIERHHGRLWAEPNDGPGATFSFSIPRDPESVTDRGTAPSMRHRRSHRMHERSLVSVVDDDESVRESLPDLLRQFGFAAEAFSSAEAFLASDVVGETSCLLLDVAMPGMSGPDLQQELTRRRQRSRSCSSPRTETRPSVRACSRAGPWSACSSRSARQPCWTRSEPRSR